MVGRPWGTIARGRAGLAGSLRSLVSSVVLAALAGLVVLHGWLLWKRIVEGQLLEPGVGLRWGAGALLLVGLHVLRQAGVPLLWGRRALAYWLLVLLLHAVAYGPVPETPQAVAQGPGPAQLLFIWPVSVAPLVVAIMLTEPWPRVLTRKTGQPRLRKDVWRPWNSEPP